MHFSAFFGLIFANRGKQSPRDFSDYCRPRKHLFGTRFNKVFRARVLVGYREFSQQSPLCWRDFGVVHVCAFDPLKNSENPGFFGCSHNFAPLPRAVRRVPTFSFTYNPPKQNAQGREDSRRARRCLKILHLATTLIPPGGNIPGGY